MKYEDRRPNGAYEEWIWEERESFKAHRGLDEPEEEWWQWLDFAYFYHLERALAYAAERIAKGDDNVSSHNEACETLVSDLERMRLEPVWVVNEFPGAGSYILDSIEERITALASMPKDKQRRSKEWRYLRRSALNRAGYRCETCNAAKRLQVHHRTYERVGNEKLEDVRVLCASCHSAVHRAAGARLFHPMTDGERA